MARKVVGGWQGGAWQGGASLGDGWRWALIVMGCDGRWCWRVVGPHCTTSLAGPSSSIASSGVTTVVLPPPMIIWWHEEAPSGAVEVPSRTPDMNASTSLTCCSRSRKVDMNSKASRRGSKLARSRAPSSPPREKKADGESRSTRTKWRRAASVAASEAARASISACMRRRSAS